METDNFILFFDALGILGMCVLLFAYFMLQRNKWAHDSLQYLLSNISGAALLLISLWWSWNLPSFLLECAWLAIGVYGLVNRHKKRANP